MTTRDQLRDRLSNSRRSVLKAGAAASVGSALGLSGSTLAQNDDDNDDNDDNDDAGNGDDGAVDDGDDDAGDDADDEYRQAWMFNDEVRPGAVFRVASPAFEDTPWFREQVGEDVGAATLHVVEYFNTNEEMMLYLPDGVSVEEDALYTLHEEYTAVDESDDPALTQVQFRRLDDQEFAFDLDEEDVELVDGGGEAAVRPENFAAGSVFRITSESLGWVPGDVEESGYFTDYNNYVAEYLGTDEEFMFFPQEGASVEVDGLYVMRDEWELFDPVGNLVATEFDRVDEESLPVDEEFL